ncbi:ADP-ribosyltransferase [Paenactinomyces guangxiensis]|uniref:ADP ribosyltransferase domain-containing protein n=1 Tax=Paenactinomyces guangxiensis TaxID=1490290 RepID=A0A7W1WUK2_9BACL|nr:ADP-ribosyltransferase [Paenactinomyces guangxiensis]MBA4496350.1 hypothetical protein [Paenactinomyces guangxiensis]MBH8593616.1 hypothetical protein [Paenactinomyces guangxiensis]
MSKYFHRLFVFILFVIVGTGIFGFGEVYATGGGGFDVPQINDDFNKGKQGPGPQKEESVNQNSKVEDGGVWDWIKDAASGAWEWTKEVASDFWDWFTGVLDMITSVVIVVGSFLKGVWNAVVDAVKGIWNIITSPVETVKNLFHAITNPIDTGKAIWKLISDSWERDVINGDANSRAEWFGYAIGQVALALVGTKGLDKAAKLSKGSQVVSKTGKVTQHVPNKPFTKFNNLVEAQTWINKHYGNWPSTLTKAEYEAVRAYTGNNYANINNVLRGIEHSYQGKNGQYVDLISQALKKHPVPEDVMVYRGAGKVALGKYQNLPPDQLVGKVIEDKGFMSTSVNPSSAFSNDIMFNIKVPKGTPGAYVGGLSHFPDEMELLLDKGQKMIITEVKPVGGKLEITCEVLKGGS